MEVPGATMGDGIAEQADFVAELVRQRMLAQLSQAALGALMGYDRTYVNKIERGALEPTAQFARNADTSLHLSGALFQRWESFDASKRRQALPSRRSARQPAEDTAADLVVPQDEAWLVFDGETYTLRMRKRIVNVGEAPVTRFFIRIAVDRFPGDPARSNEHHRRHPLTLDELSIEAHRDGDSMLYEVKQDRDSLKELWLLFRNESRQFPLYPGEETCLEYGYRVSAEKWGRWFQRAVRLPTRRLAVHLQLPAALDPAVWGTEVSPTAEQRPLATPVQAEVIGSQARFHWSTSRPPLEARYRLQWTFRAVTRHHAHVTTDVGDRIRDLGIRQEDDPVLRRVASPFVLPAEADEAAALHDELLDYVRRLSLIYPFTKGMGLAAPQIGVSRALAVVRPPGGKPAVALLNPVVTSQSSEEDEQYEGCLSLFDVRGRTRRPLAINVQVDEFDGSSRIISFDHGLARLVLHEIDHLAGTLYTDRLVEGSALVPLEEYQGTYRAWQY